MIELYYFENSICSERVLMTLAEKSATDWVPRHIHLFKREQFDPAYLKLNPKAQVPTLVHEGEVIRESSIICDYLDDLYPDPPSNHNPVWTLPGCANGSKRRIKQGLRVLHL